MLKSWIKNILWRPRVAMCGENSYIRRPRSITNGKYIRIGDRLVMLGHGVVGPVEYYRGQTFTPDIRIGDDVYIGSHVKIDCIERVEIEDGCVLSDYVFISDLSHGFDPTKGLIMKQNVVPMGGVKLGRNCFVGMGSSILPGVQLGEWCVVGTRSVVTRSFPSYSMIAGSPARLLKQYSRADGKWHPAESSGRISP